MTGFDVGIVTLGPPTARLRSGAERSPLKRETRLLQALAGAGLSVITGGCVLAENDQVAANSSLLRQHVHNLVEHHCGAYILHVTPGTRAGDIAELVRYVERESEAPSRLVVFADPRSEPSLVPTLLATTEILDRGAVPFVLVTGNPDDDVTRSRLASAVRFQRDRRDTRPRVAHVAELLKRKKGILVGTTYSRASGISLDADSLMHAIGINVEELRETTIEERVTLLLSGARRVDDVPDPRLRAAARHLGTDQLPPLAHYFATLDLVRELEGHFVVLDGGGSHEMGFARAWLSNDRGPDGQHKDVIPAAGASDGENGVAQLILHLLSESVAGFLKVKDLTNNVLRLEIDEGGPPALVGKGTSPFGATAAGHPVTVAALTRFRQRYRWHGFESETVACEGAPNAWSACVLLKEPLEEFLRRWPGAHAVVTHGHHAAKIVELAHSLSMGFRLHNEEGQLLHRPL